MSQVILFDLDGTLTESGEGIINCVAYALEKLGKKEEHPEKLQCFVGPPLKEQFMKYAGLSEEEAEQAVVYYRERYTTKGMFENCLYPKVPELLELLKINDKILGVASSKPEVYVKQILEHFQIADYFTAIVGSELDGRRTDKAEVIEEALRRMHLEEERDKVLMVGDRSHDVQGAVSCGLQCIGVTYGYGSREELESAGAVYIADSVEDLGILASPNDEETTEKVESVRKDTSGSMMHVSAKASFAKKMEPVEENTGEERENEYPKKKIRILHGTSDLETGVSVPDPLRRDNAGNDSSVSDLYLSGRWRTGDRKRGKENVTEYPVCDSDRRCGGWCYSVSVLQKRSAETERGIQWKPKEFRVGTACYLVQCDCPCDCDRTVP